MRYPLKRRVIEVEWVDSTSTPGWDTADVYRAMPMGPLVSVGYVLSQDKRAIRLMQSMSGAAGHVAGAIAIPMGCVTKIRTIRRG